MVSLTLLRVRAGLSAALVASLLAVGLLAAAARAQGTPPVLDDVLVTGEHTGPGMWHVQRGNAHLWILGSMSPLPHGITWRSKQFEQVLETTHLVLVQKPFDVGIVQVLWLIVTEHRLLLVGGGKRLKDVMPASLHDRFATLRVKYSDDADKWEHYRPLIAAAFLQQAAFHKVGLSTRLDLGAAVRVLAKKHGVRVEELKIAGVHDLLDALKTMPLSTENTCVAASLVTVEKDLPRLVERAQAWAAGNIERIEHLQEPPEIDACRVALDSGSGANELIAQIRRTWLLNMEESLRSPGTTVAVVNMDMLLEKGGLLDELRAKGYEITAP